MSAGADRPGELSDGYCVTRLFQSLQGAAKLIVHQRHLQAERRRFGMDPMAAPNFGGELLFPGFGRDNLSERFYILNQNGGRLHHLHGERGVTNVTAGEAEMKPA